VSTSTYLGHDTKVEPILTYVQPITPTLSYVHITYKNNTSLLILGKYIKTTFQLYFGQNIVTPILPEMLGSQVQCQWCHPSKIIVILDVL
jgi:hypothetical protein